MSTPDGREVVATQAEAQRLPVPPLLVVDAVLAFMDSRCLGAGAISWERIGGGHSNVTYLLERDTERFVLRRGPRPPLPKSTHDMVREARIQRLLLEQGMPVPVVLAVCDDEQVLGVPFYLMSYLDGYIVTDTIPADLDPPDRRWATSAALVETLVTLHSIDLASGELASLGRPDGFLRRQVDLFSTLWELNTTRNLPEVDRLGRWLVANMPTSQAATVIHGDYRAGNVMFEPNSSTRVRAVLDWEMATVGDPLADLGYLTATYAEPGRLPTFMELTSVTRQPGYMNREQLVSRYQERMDLDFRGLPWYQTLALWKASVFCEAIYTRWVKGERADDTTFGPSLEAGIPQLLQVAVDTAGIVR